MPAGVSVRAKRSLTRFVPFVTRVFASSDAFLGTLGERAVRTADAPLATPARSWRRSEDVRAVAGRLPTSVLPTLVKIKEPTAAIPIISGIERRRQYAYVAIVRVSVMNTIDAVPPRLVKAVTQRSPAGVRSEIASSCAG